MNRSARCSGLALLLASSVALAQPAATQALRGPVMTLNYLTVGKEKGSTSSMKGSVVVVLFFKPGEGNANEAVELVQSESSALGGVQAVGVCLSTDANQLADVVKQKGVSFPVHFDPKTGAAGIAKQWGVRAAPFCAILDTEGRLVSMCAPAQLPDRLRLQLELTPPRSTDVATLQKGDERLDLAEAMIKARKPRSAARFLSQTPAEARTDPNLSARFSALTVKIEESLPGMLEQSEKLIADEKLADAVVMLEQLSAAFEGTAAQAKILDQLHSVTDDAELKVKADKGRTNAEAADLLATALDLDEIKQRAKAFRVLERIQSEYGKTPSAAPAKKIVAGWESDPAQKRQLYDALYGEKANSALRAADALSVSNLKEKARANYEKLIKEYPFTTAAEKAEKALKEMK